MSEDITLTDYSLSDIAYHLTEIKKCVKLDRFKLSVGSKRKANQEFVLNYNMTRERQRQVLLCLSRFDFCHCLINERYGHEHEDLFVFMPKLTLKDCFGQEKKVTLYIKMNLVTTGKTPITIIISMHEARYEPQYCFDRERGCKE